MAPGKKEKPINVLSKAQKLLCTLFEKRSSLSKYLLRFLARDSFFAQSICAKNVLWSRNCCIHREISHFFRWLDWLSICGRTSRQCITLLRSILMHMCFGHAIFFRFICAVICETYNFLWLFLQNGYLSIQNSGPKNTVSLVSLKIGEVKLAMFCKLLPRNSSR